MTKFEIEWRNPESLVPYPHNAKVHSSTQIEKIAQQIASFGFDQPIVVDPNMVIIKGHGRREAALRLKLKEVPVIVTALDEYQAIAARIADNKVSEAPWDPEKLKFDLGILKLEKFDLSLTAIDLPQIETILNPADSSTMFGSDAHKNVKERKEDYESSEVRQIILVTDPENFEKLMAQFIALQEKFSVETNIEVIERLIAHYEATC